MARTRDSQQGAVYAWERALAREWYSDDGGMTLEECRALIARVWGEYLPGGTPPEVVDGRGTRNARGGRRRINLPRWARSPIVVLHETAHALLELRPVAWHGPEFATLCLDLWERYAGIDRVAARRAGIEQRPRRVHFAPAAAVPQRKTRRYIKWQEEVRSARARLRALEAARPPR